MRRALLLSHILWEGIKRESGENPGQSRCCKLHNGLSNTLATDEKVGKALNTEVSQKTCNAYYFDGFEERPEEKEKAFIAYTSYSRFHKVVIGSDF